MQRMEVGRMEGCMERTVSEEIENTVCRMEFVYRDLLRLGKIEFGVYDAKNEVKIMGQRKFCCMDCGKTTTLGLWI